MTGDESQARLQWLIRDHDWEGFRDRSAPGGHGFYLETRYGVGTVEVTITDAYYNMKERSSPIPSCWTGPGRPSAGRGWNPGTCPIRGGTDGAKLSWRGLPCPNLSTGGYHFHGVHEYIPVEALETMANVLAIWSPVRRKKKIEKTEIYLLTNREFFDILNIARYGGRTRRHSSVG